MLRSGSTPAAIQSATLSSAFAVSSDGVGVLAGQRVPVGDEVEAVVLLLQRDPVLQRADEVAEVQLARRPHAGNDASFAIRAVRPSSEITTGRLDDQRRARR